MINLLKESKTQEEIFILWQNIDGQRKTKPERLVNISDTDIQFTGVDKTFIEGLDLFVHSKKSQYIFKLDSFNFDNGFKCPFPKEIVFVGDTFTVHETTQHIKNEMISHDSKTENIKHNNLSGSVSGTDKINSKMSASLKTDKYSTFESVKKLDEDAVFASKRAAPRARPKKEKKVTLKLLGSDDRVLIYSLFDLSTGGMGFNITGKEMFQKNDKLLVTAIDGKDLDKHMIGIIRNIREEGPGTFRVGVQFIDE